MTSDDLHFSARVIANHGAELLVCDDHTRYFTAVPQKKLGLLVCGDIVTCQATETVPANSNSPAHPYKQSILATELHERSATLSRTDRRGQPKPIASNVTQLVVVTAPKPPFDPLLIDRYTIAARHIGAQLLLVINKADMLTGPSAAEADDIEDLYASIGYRVLRCSSHTGQGIDKLTTSLAEQVSILVGQSGVGKSSLLNKLLPEKDIKTGALSEISGLGRHTTTVTTWYDLPGSGAIIDSAGVRQFSLEHLSGVDIQAGFKEISELSATCRFRDCTHTKEPDCAVLNALQKENISHSRYRHFNSIRTGDG